MSFAAASPAGEPGDLSDAELWDALFNAPDIEALQPLLAEFERRPRMRRTLAHKPAEQPQQDDPDALRQLLQAETDVRKRWDILQRLKACRGF